MDLAEIVIKVDTRDLKSANDEFDKFAVKGKKAANEGIEPIGKSASGAAGKVKLLVGAVVALASGTVLQAAISASKEFSASISNLSAITGATGDQLEYLKQQAMDIGRTTTLSASQAATAFKLIASAKPDLLESGEALNAVTRSAVTLAEAASIDLSVAAEALGKSLNQFGAGAEEANRFINVLAAGSKFGAAGIAEVSESLKNVGAVASSVGLSIEETTTAIELLAAGGLSGAEAGTALRGVLLKLEKEGNDKFKPAVVGLGTALQNLRDAGMDSTEMIKLFGMESITAANTLIANADAADSLEKALTGTNTAYEQAEINVNNLAGDQLALNSAVEAAAIAFGQKLEPAMRSLTQFGTAAFSALATNLDKVITALEIISVILISRVIPGLYAFVTAGGLATAATTAWTTATVALNTALTFLGGPAGIAIAVVGVLTLLASKTKTVQERMRDARAEMHRMNTETLRDAIAQEERYNRSLILKIERLQRSGTAHKAARDALARHARELLQSNNALLEYNRELEENERTVNGQEDAIEAITPVIETYTGAIGDASGATATFSDTAQDVITDLANQKAQLSMTDLQWQIYQNTLKAGTDATPEQRRAIIDMTTSIYNQRNAIDEAAQAEEDKKQVVKEALKEQQKRYEEFHGKVSGFFVDLFENGKSAFSNLADKFKSMLTKMVADFLASKIMSYLGNFLSKIGGAAGAFGSFMSSAAASAGGSAAGGALTGATAGGALTGAAAGGAGAAGAGGVIAGAFSAIGTAASQFVGGLTGGAFGANAMMPTVFSQAGATLNAAIFNPITAALAGLLLAWKVFGTKSTPSFNAGFMLSPLGIPGEYPIAPFASGIEPAGFTRRADREQSDAVIETFRALDASIVGLYNQAGIDFKLSGAGISGYAETGLGSGRFYGAAGEEGKPGVPIEDQLTRYAKEMFEKGSYYGLPDKLITKITSAGNYADMLERAQGMIDGSHAEGLNRVPYDGYVAELHAGERVMTKSQTDAQDNMASDIQALRQDIGDIMLAVARNTSKQYRIYDRWDKNGLPPTRS